MSIYTYSLLSNTWQTNTYQNEEIQLAVQASNDSFNQALNTESEIFIDGQQLLSFIKNYVAKFKENSSSKKEPLVPENEKEFIKQLKQRRLTNVSDEINRLKKLDPSINRLLRSYPMQRDLLVLTIGHALEIKNLYSDTHYVFTHSCTQITTVVYYFLDQLYRKLQHDTTFSYFKNLRWPLEKESAHQFLDSHPELMNRSESDHSFREKLISADGYFWSEKLTESSLYFLTTNTSVTIDRTANNINRISKDILTQIISSANIPVTDHEKIIKKFHQITDNLQTEIQKEGDKNFLIGDLYMICIPKDLVRDKDKSPVYASIHHGYPIEHSTDFETVQTLDHIQKLHYPSKGMLSSLTRQLVKSKEPQFIPQYRILGSSLRAEEWVRVFRFTSIPKHLSLQMKYDIKNLIDEITKGMTLS